MFSSRALGAGIGVSAGSNSRNDSAASGNNNNNNSSNINNHSPSGNSNGVTGGGILSSTSPLSLTSGVARGFLSGRNRTRSASLISPSGSAPQSIRGNNSPLPRSVRRPSMPTTSTISHPVDSSERLSPSDSGSIQQDTLIRLIPIMDHSSSTPSQYNEPIERRFNKSFESILIGRCSDKKEKIQDICEDQAPIIFRNKVVSRRHAELWYQDNKFYIRDVKSSSGTFLNYVRLSPSAKVSEPFEIKDGDFLQLGMDFRGSSEFEYKCVRLRVQINSQHGKKVNNFNMETHETLFTRSGLALTDSSSSSNNQECSICLVAIAPCQALFVAPCSHVWHYKCIRPIVVKNYPNFQCPNCRSMCDLEAEIEVPHFELKKTSSDSQGRPSEERQEEKNKMQRLEEEEAKDQQSDDTEQGDNRNQHILEALLDVDSDNETGPRLVNAIPAENNEGTINVETTGRELNLLDIFSNDPDIKESTPHGMDLSNSPILTPPSDAGPFVL